MTPVSGKITQASYYSPEDSYETITWDAARININNMQINGTGGIDGVDFKVDGSEVNFKIVFNGSISPDNIFIGANLAHPTSTSFTLKGKTLTSNQLSSLSYVYGNELPLPPPPPSYKKNIPVSSLIFPLVISDSQFSTTLSLINPSASTSITMTLYSSDGSSISTSTSAFPAGETMEGSLTDFFPNIQQPTTQNVERRTQNAEGGIFWIMIESTEKIKGFATISQSSVISHQSSVYQLPAIASGANTLYFPLVMSDEAWQTHLSILNPNDEEAPLVLTPYDKDGYPLAEYSSVGSLKGKVLSIKYVQEYFVDSLPPGTAWIKLESDSKIIGVETISTMDNHNIYMLPAAVNGYSTLNFQLPVMAVGEDYAQRRTSNVEHQQSNVERQTSNGYLILLNLSLQQGATFSINAYDSDGNLVGYSSSIGIAPGALKFDTISHYFDGYLPPQSTGIKIDSDGALNGFVLFDGKIIFPENQLPTQLLDNSTSTARR